MSHDWPDPIHRAYLTLLARRHQYEFADDLRQARYSKSRRELRVMARQLAAKSGKGQKSEQYRKAYEALR